MAPKRTQRGSRTAATALADYHAKRDFAVTAEPKGAVTAGGRDALSFVVQKHGARHLHYDFRLEWNGTLKSWAVPKGPSLDPGEKRLAVRVEDHPVEYGSFEGVIPAGEYGAGAVIVWDRGTWVPEGDPDAADAKGRLNFDLYGEKLKGAWALVRIGGGGQRGARRRGDGAGKNWLLIKRTDAAAQRDSGDALVVNEARSVASGRRLEDVAAGKAAGAKAARALPKRAKQKPAAKAAPAKRAARRDGAALEFIPPQLATRVAAPPAGTDWLHEVKFDGYRIQAHVQGKTVRLFTRTGLDWTDRFASLVPLLRKLDAESAIIDGEIVALDDRGLSDFSKLQDALSARDDGALFYYAFDLLHRDGEDLTARPLTARKEALRAVLAGTDLQGRLRYSEDFATEGGVFLREVCSLALEGAISKRADAPYHSGRSSAWLKSKCVERQEMVVLGFTPGTVGPGQIGAVLLGQHEKGKLVYRGRAGTGFSEASGRNLRKRLDALRIDAPAAAVPPPARRDALWVTPKLVAEIEFIGFTADKLLRHASFKGLREDKAADEVTGEKPVPAPRIRGGARPARAPAAAKQHDPKLFAVLTHPDRVLYEAQGITKRGLAEYYVEVAALMLPHVAGRPLSLVRCPGGTKGQCFYQKSIPTGTPEAVFEVHNAARGKAESYPAIRDLAGLIGLAQMGVLEVHVWGCKADSIMTPDRIVFDLDPHEGVAWTDVVAAAFEIRDRLAAIGLRSFLKTTGGKGLHVAAAIAPRLPWDTVKAFTRAFAAAIQKDAPDRFVITAAKQARHNRIFIDYLRNGYGATFIAPYSPRARPGAPLSMPIEWDELTPALHADHFTLGNVAARLGTLRADPWTEMLKSRQSLTAKMLAKFGVEVA